jgi:hypothetical protein
MGKTVVTEFSMMLLHTAGILTFKGSWTDRTFSYLKGRWTDSTFQYFKGRWTDRTFSHFLTRIRLYIGVSRFEYSKMLCILASCGG